jgi:hypothetical protein
MRETDVPTLLDASKIGEGEPFPEQMFESLLAPRIVVVIAERAYASVRMCRGVGHGCSQHGEHGCAEEALRGNWKQRWTRPGLSIAPRRND